MSARMQAFFSGIPEKVLNYKFLYLGISLVILIVSILGSQKLQFDMSMESFFEESDAVKITYNHFRETFSGDDSIYIVYKAKDGDVLSDRSIKALRLFHEEIDNLISKIDEDHPSILEHLVEMKSLLNVSYLEVEDGGLNSREFINDFYPTNDVEREELRQQALSHRDFPLFYITKDSRFGGIYIRTDFGIEQEYNDSTGSELSEFGANANPVKFKPTDIQDYASFIKALTQVLNKPELTDALEFHPVGNPIIMAFFNDVINVEMGQFFLITFILIFIVLFILFRNFSAVFWPLIIILFSIVTTIGFMGWVGYKMNIMFGLLVLLLLVIGIADAVHILSGYIFYRRKGFAHFETIKMVYRKSGMACFLTSITTSIGLFSLALVKIPPIRYFGISASFGVMITFVFTMILLPILINFWKPISEKQLKQSEAKNNRIQKLLDLLEPFTKRFRYGIIAITIIIIALSSYGLSLVKVDSNMVEIIKDNSPIKIAHNIVDEFLGGSQNMDIFIQFDTLDALKDPQVLNIMDRFQSEIIKDFPEFVTRTNSIVDVVKNSFQVLNQNEADKYIIPQEKNLLSQTLLLFENANYDDRKLLVSDDYRNARINVRLKNYGSMEYLTFFDATQKKVEALFKPLSKTYPGIDVKVTGGLALMMKVIDYISWSQIQSFGLTLLVITIMLLFVFGNPKYGLIGIIPNLIPVTITFGVMGLFDIPLDGDTLIIAPIVMGVAVDDTIHFLTHYRMEIKETDGKISESIRLSLKEAGQAISFSTLILVIGFLVLMFSIHKGLAHFGLLSMIAFTSALLSDLLLLPALCHVFKLGKLKTVKNI